MSTIIKVLSPYGVIYNEEIEEMICPSRTGQLGVLPGHATLVTAVDIGVLIFRKGSVWDSIAVIGGLASIADKDITLIVNRATKSGSITRREATKLLKEATDRLTRSAGEKDRIDAALAFKRASALYAITRAESRNLLNFTSFIILEKKQ